MRDVREISKIHVVPYSHHDHAWTNTRQWHIWRYIEGFCLVLDRMREDPDYTLVIDNILHSFEVFEQYCPSRLEEFRQRVREGRINVVNGGMALARPADFDGELLIRNAADGRRAFCERFGKMDLPVYFNADTACGSSQMPQILSGLGHRYYRFMRPEMTLNRKNLPFHFVWRGMDGSEITVGRGEYGGCLFCEWENEKGSWEQRRDAFVREELENKLCCPGTDMILLNIGQDDCLPGLNLYDHPYDMDSLMREWNAREKSKMVYSTFDRFFDELSERALPMVEGPLDACELSFNAPFRADASLRKLRMLTERGLLLTEKLNAISVSLGGASEEETILSLWQRLYRFSGHAMQHLLDQDYAEVRDGAAATVALIEELRKSLLQKIASAVRSDHRVAQLIVNPTLCGDEQIVELHLTTPHHIDGLRLTDPEGNELSWQITDGFSGDKPYDCPFSEVTVATRLRVPPMGWTVVGVECGRRAMQAFRTEDAKDQVIDNGVFRMTLENGRIARVETDFGVICGREPVALRFTRTEPTQSWTVNWKAEDVFEYIPEKSTLTENGPLRWRIVTEGSVANSPASLEYTISADSPVIECRLTLESREDEGWFSLNLPCGGEEELYAAVPFGEEARKPSKEPYAENDNSPLCFERGWNGAFFAGGYATFIAGAGRMALLQGDCSNMVRLDAEKGELEQMLYRTLDMRTRTDWTKHMCADASGRGVQHFSFSIAVLPPVHDPDLLQTLLQKQRSPLCTCTRFALDSGEAPGTGSLIRTEGTAVQISAIYNKENAMFVRFFETRGSGGELRMRIPEGFRSGAFTDLKEDPCEKPMRIDAGWICFELRPHEIATIKLM